MKILASDAVLNGSSINILHKENGIWILLSHDEFENNPDFDEDNLSIVTEEMLYERIPKLKGQLEQPDSTTINIDYTTGEININKKHFHLGIPTHDAKSSRQVNASFSFFHWIKSNSKEYLTILLVAVILLALAINWGWFFYIPLGLYLAFHVLSTFKTRDMFYSGDLCPGIVIDEVNSKIAVLTNLSLGFGDYPLIRIKKVVLPKKYRKVGTKIPIAGAYQNTKNYPHWNYFEPIPMPAGITDDNVIQDKINQIPTVEWVELKSEFKKLTGEPKEGYYPYNIAATDWNDIDLVKVEWMQFGEEK